MNDVLTCMVLIVLSLSWETIGFGEHPPHLQSTYADYELDNVAEVGTGHFHLQK